MFLSRWCIAIIMHRFTSAIFFVYVYFGRVSFTLCRFAVIVSSLCETSYLHYEAQFCAPIHLKSGVSSKNRIRIIWTSKSGGFRENREGWQPCCLPSSQSATMRQHMW